MKPITKILKIMTITIVIINNSHNKNRATDCNASHKSYVLS